MRLPDFEELTPKSHGKLTETVIKPAKSLATEEYINMLSRAQEADKEYQEGLIKKQMGIEEDEPEFEFEMKKPGSVVVERKDKDEEREEDER